jgi:hypothetical protein
VKVRAHIHPKVKHQQKKIMNISRFNPRRRARAAWERELACETL